jgi:hypothetical protein
MKTASPLVFDAALAAKVEATLGPAATDVFVVDLPQSRKTDSELTWPMKSNFSLLLMDGRDAAK